MARWLELVEFTSACGISLLFDLNIMLGRRTDAKSPGAGTDIKSGAGTGDRPGSARAGGGGFDVSNIRSLLEYTAERGLDVWGFELGNEKQVIYRCMSIYLCPAIPPCLCDLWSFNLFLMTISQVELTPIQVDLCNLYPISMTISQVQLTPIEVAEALGQVKAIIDELWPGADNDARPRLVGPALNPRPDWLEEMMMVGP